MADFQNRQQVEGFARLLSAPGIETRRGMGLGPDYRGPSGAGATREWWRPVQPDEPDLVWERADVPEAVDTTFTFVGESADLLENLYPPNQATVYADDKPVLTFDLGQRTRRLWSEGDWALEFTPRQVHGSLGDYHRQFGPAGDSGIYRLAAPASALTAGRPLRLKVELQPLRSDAINWFAVRERPDALEVSPRTNAEQIEQLQDELIRLKRVVGSLARRSYADLIEERLPTEDVMIYSDGRVHAHDADVLLLQNGDLLVCWREAGEHISNDGKMVMVRSTDGGRTWGERQVLREYPYTDDREASLVQLRDGEILANHWPNTNYDAQGRYHRDKDPSYRGRPPGIYIGRSTDDGHTWTWSEKGIETAPFGELMSYEPIMETESGRLLMACYCHTGEGEERRTISVAYCSDDRGYTWRYLSTIADVPGVQLNETVLVQTRSGRLISMARTESGPAYYEAISDDGGESWTPAKPSAVPGYRNPCSLIELPDGPVLCVYGSRIDPSGIYVVASHDDGETWDMANRRVIRDDFPNPDSCYPSTVVMPDGRVLTVYYFNMFHRLFIVGSFFDWPVG